MDLAFTGEVRNDDTVRAVVAAVPEVRVQASGGIATVGAVEAMLDAGASRVVIGSAVLDDPQEARRLLDRAPGVAIVGIEVADGRIRARGAADVDLDLMATLGWLALTPGVQAVLVTSVARVGSLEGPDVGLVRRVMRRGFPVLAAGGIRSLEDLVSLRDAGAVGAVIGRAALEGALDLEDALTWAAV
jgi:phosphoribosylformimino-5-aminoimidazole carboxamide ribotide isomerase